jgi:hypothetical protein
LVFSYYKRLSARQQSIYRQSDEVRQLRLPHPAELHGLYLPEEDGASARIQVWMRTAKHKKVVAFRSFLRTVLHELCHHLDYEFFHFPETLHTEGFYNRESSLFHQLVPEARPQQKRTESRKRTRI